nr:hypothetical protein [Ralstonia sp. LMG 18095]
MFDGADTRHRLGRIDRRGGLVSLFSVKLGVAAPAYRLAFFTMGVVTVFSALIFRKLDAKPTPLLTKNLEAEAVQAR